MHLGAPLRAYMSGHVGTHNTPHNTSRFKQVQASSSREVPVFGPKSRACGACSFRPPPRAVGVPEVQQNYGLDGRVPRRWRGVGVLVGSAPGNFTAKLATLGLICGAAAFGRRPRGPESKQGALLW